LVVMELTEQSIRLREAFATDAGSSGV